MLSRCKHILLILQNPGLRFWCFLVGVMGIILHATFTGNPSTILSHKKVLHSQQENQNKTLLRKLFKDELCSCPTETQTDRWFVIRNYQHIEVHPRRICKSLKLLKSPSQWSNSSIGFSAWGLKGSLFQNNNTGRWWGSTLHVVLEKPEPKDISVHHLYMWI
jgi:hypothetical protein